MLENQRQIESRGSDVETAIRNGLSRLGVNRSDVKIEILDEGSRGLLGIGSRDATVRLIYTITPVAPPPAAKVVVPPPSSPPAPQPEKVVPKVVKEIPMSVAIKPVEEGEETETAVLDEETLLHEQTVAVQIVQGLLQKMQVGATVSAHLSPQDDMTGQRINILDIHGDDLGVLIGPRGETLSSLQYITRLMVAHQLKRRTDFIVDVESYRQRREQALSRLAEHMATKAAKQKRPISLEPMPPYERRIIHMTLRDSVTVYTESTGEGNRRKVRIIPK